MVPPVLTAKGEEEWQALRHHIEWSKGFILVFLFSSDAALLKLLRERLAASCQLRSAPLETLSPREPSTLAQDVLEPIRQRSSLLAEAHSPLWLEQQRSRGRLPRLLCLDEHSYT